MRISDWSSDVCSSDLPAAHRRRRAFEQGQQHQFARRLAVVVDDQPQRRQAEAAAFGHDVADRPERPRQGAAAIEPRAVVEDPGVALAPRSEEHTSELQSLMRITYAALCLKKNN